MNKNNGSLGFIGALTLIFITLKLTGYIDWSWWWILSPMWITGIIVIIIIIILILYDTYEEYHR